MNTENEYLFPSDRQLNPVVLESARVLLRRVFRILQGCGVGRETLRVMHDEMLESVLEDCDSRANQVTARQALVCSDIVLKWRRHPKYLTSEGVPAQLSLEGRRPNFVELVEAAAPGANWQELIETMIELGVVRRLPNNRIELLSDSIVACSGRDGTLVANEFVLEHICGFLGSVEYNVFDKPSRERGRFERACYALVPEDVVPVLEKLISARGQDFVDVVDEWLARRTVKPSDEATSVLVGAGAYVFVRKNVP